MTPTPSGASLEGIILADAVSEQLVDLGRQAGLTLVTVIRHRF